MALLEGEREKLQVDNLNSVERAELLRVVIDRIIAGVKEAKNQVMTDHEAAVVLQDELPTLKTFDTYHFLRLLRLPPDILKMVRSGLLSHATATRILKTKDEYEEFSMSALKKLIDKWCKFFEPEGNDVEIGDVLPAQYITHLMRKVLIEHGVNPDADQPADRRDGRIEGQQIIDKARGVAYGYKEMAGQGKKSRDIPGLLGITRGTMFNWLALDRLPEDIKHLIILRQMSANAGMLLSKGEESLGEDNYEDLVRRVLALRDLLLHPADRENQVLLFDEAMIGRLRALITKDMPNVQRRTIRGRNVVKEVLEGAADVPETEIATVEAPVPEVPPDFCYLNFDVFLPPEIKNCVREGVRVREVLSSDPDYAVLAERLPSLAGETLREDRKAEYVLIVAETGETPVVCLVKRSLFERLRTEAKPNTEAMPKPPVEPPVQEMKPKDKGVKKTKVVPPPKVKVTQKVPAVAPVETSPEILRAIKLSAIAAGDRIPTRPSNAALCKFDRSLPEKVKKLFRDAVATDPPPMCFIIRLGANEISGKLDDSELRQFFQLGYLSVYFPEGKMWAMIHQNFLQKVA